MERLRARIRRCQARLADLRGGSWQHEVSPPQGDRVRYLFDGIKSYDDLEDDAAILCVWIWSLKDRIGREFKRNGKTSLDLEALIEKSQELRIIADLANAEKHGPRRNSKSGLSPSFRSPKLSSPKAAIGSMTFSGQDVSTSIKEPNLTTYRLPVVDKKGTVIGDFRSIASDAMLAWDKILQGIERQPMRMIASVAPATGKVPVGDDEAQ